MVECRELVKIYKEGGNDYRAVSGVSFSVPAGDFLALMGPSGCGKSTLLNILGCLDCPTSGEYILDGRPVSELGDYERSLMRREKLGFIFQSYNLLPRLSALENVCLPMGYRGVRRGEAAERAQELLSSVGLKSKTHKSPLQLSGGERQRVAIARALSNNPRLLLADEPTGNLDSASSAEIITLFGELNAAGLTIVMVTHDPTVAAKARRVLRIQDGVLVNR